MNRDLKSSGLSAEDAISEIRRVRTVRALESHIQEVGWPIRLRWVSLDRFQYPYPVSKYPEKPTIPTSGVMHK